MGSRLLFALILAMAMACEDGTDGEPADDGLALTDLAVNDPGRPSDSMAADSSEVAPDSPSPGDPPHPGDPATDPEVPVPDPGGLDPGGPVPEGCCAPSGSCPGGGVCAPSEEEGPWSCVPAHDGSSCWSHAECGDGEECKGVFVCPCGAVCATDSSPGTCAPRSPLCCHEPSDCLGGLVCAGYPLQDPGRCMTAPGAGRCWSDADCPQGSSCKGRSFCPCEWTDCPETPRTGQCVPDQEQPCCGSGYPPCPESQFCATSLGALEGRCGPLLGAGQCYNDTHCPDGSNLVCDGAVTCGCGQSCIVAPGSCVAAPWNLCCSTDATCAPEHCVMLSPEAGVCLPDAAGGCWTDAQCGPGKFCKGVAICPCSQVCDFDDTPGACFPLPAGCCTTSDQCSDGKVCIGAGDIVPGRCLPPLVERGCWSQDDCAPWPPGPWEGDEWCEWCVEASFCPCVEACPDCGIECPANQMGRCELNGCI